MMLLKIFFGMCWDGNQGQRELSAYSRDFGAKIDSDEEQIFFDRSQQEIKNRNDPILNLYKEATGGREPGA
jgi:hypothetical protein